MYDAARKPVAVFRDWGGNFVEAPSGCGGIIASGPGDRSSADFLALYNVMNRAPVRLGDPADSPAPWSPCGPESRLPVIFLINVMMRSASRWIAAVSALAVLGSIEAARRPYYGGELAHRNARGNSFSR